ncbi:MAG: hypothetical protein R3B68_09920 [Phycisphaerales bacterium]
MSHEHTPSHTRRPRAWFRRFGRPLAFALVLGMLIWVRLRLVTHIPRAAYAEPEMQTPAAPPRATAGDLPAADRAVDPDTDSLARHADAGTP